MSASISEALHNSVGSAMAPLSVAVGAVREARTWASGAEDIEDVFRTTGMLIVAIERLEEVAKEVARTARTALRDAMANSGCMGTANNTISLTLADAPRTVVITDRKSLALSRPDLFLAQEPKPNLAAIGDELRRKKVVQGAELSNGNSPVLRLSMKRTS